MKILKIFLDDGCEIVSGETVKGARVRGSYHNSEFGPINCVFSFILS